MHLLYIYISFYHVVNQCQSPFSLFAVSSQSASLHHSKNIKESGLSSSRRATTALLMARDPARMVRSFCWWRPMTTTRKNTPWLSLSNSAWTAELPSPVNGHPRVLASTWRVARRPAASLWISVSALVLWKVSSDTTWWEMLWLASFTRSPRREESPQLVELVPSTPIMAQRNHSLPLSPTTSWRRTCSTSCQLLSWQMSLCRCGGPLTSSILLHLELNLRMRSGSLVSSWNLLRMFFFWSYFVFSMGNPLGESIGNMTNMKYVLFSLDGS